MGADSRQDTVTVTRLAALQAEDLDLTCRNAPVALTDVGGDLRDLWAGRETPDTGKRALKHPRIELSFDRPVDIARLEKALTISGQAASLGDGLLGDCVGGAESGPLATHTVRPSLLPATAAWTMANNKLGAQEFPRDFNAVVFADLGAVPDAQGPLAAGGNVTLGSFSLNHVARKPVGLVAGRDFRATSGSIFGDIYYGGVLDLPQSVWAPGSRTNAQAIDFVGAQARLTAMSSALAALPANGTTVVEPWGGVTFRGTDAKQNVFSVTATALAATSSIQFQIPNQSLAIVNVTGGSSVTVQNCGLSLNGASSGRLFWNMPAATTVSLSSIGFMGSLLAPGAAVTLANGSMEGTLVAKSLAGGGALRHAPFVGFDDVRFPQNVVFDLPNRLFAGCRYALKIDTSALTEAGACLPTAAKVDFRVALKDQPPFEREALGVRRDRRTGHATGFRVKDGINTPTAALFKRYGSSLGLGANDALELAAPVQPAGGSSAATVGFHRQKFSGVPVLGFGLTVHESNGIARAVSGRIAAGLTLATQPSVTESQALAIAITAVAPSNRPWEAPAAGHAPPTAKLAIATGVPRATAVDFRLIWRVDFTRSGVFDVHSVDINATGGGVLTIHRANSTFCTDFDDSALQSQSLTTIFAHTARYGIQELQATFATDQGNHNGYLLASTDPITIRTALGFQGNEHVVCNGDNNFNETDVFHEATGHWLARSYVQLITAQNYDSVGIAGAKWKGLDGMGTAKADLIFSSDATFWGGGDTTYPVRLASPDPWDKEVIVFNPLTVHGAEWNVQPMVVGHELTHAVRASSLKRAQRDWLLESETGAIDEGIADAMGAMFARAVLGPDSTFWCSTPFCLRDLQDPQSTSNPDTYLDTAHFYQLADPPCDSSDRNDKCGIHQNATIVGFWFYLLGRGGAGTNGNACEWEIALPVDEEASWDRARRITFAAMQQAPDHPDFFAFREATLAVAQDDVEARRIQAAWDAVGLIDPISDQQPAELATNVNPWELKLKFHVSRPGAYVAEIAELSAGGTVVTALPEVDCVEDVAGGGAMVCDQVDLKPGTQYRWRARPASALDFSVCQPPNTFTTSDEAVELFHPTELQDGVAILDWAGTISVSFPDARNIPLISPPRIRIAGSVGAQGACVTSGDNTESIGLSSMRRLIDLADGQLDPNGGDVDFNKTYYLNAQVVDDHGATGKCTTIPFKFFPMDRPEPLSPGIANFNQTNQWPGIDKGSSSVTFAWKHAGERVGDYKLQIWRRNLDTPGEHVLIPLPLASVGVRVGPPDGPHAGDPTVAYHTFVDSGLFDTAGEYVWAVTAVADNGGHQVSSTAQKSFIENRPGAGMIGYYVKLPAPVPLYPLAEAPPSEGWWTRAEWAAVDGALEYKFRVWINGQKDTTTQEATVTDPLIEGMTEGAAPPDGYCWQVEAAGKGLFDPHPGTPSEPICFKHLITTLNLIAPADGASVSVDGFEIKWTATNPPLPPARPYVANLYRGDSTLIFPGGAYEHVGDAGATQMHNAIERSTILELDEGQGYSFDVCLLFSDGRANHKCTPKRTVTARGQTLPAPKLVYKNLCAWGDQIANIDREGVFMYTNVEGSTNDEIEFLWNGTRTAGTTFGGDQSTCFVYDTLPELCPSTGPFVDCQLGDPNGVLSELSTAERDDILAQAMARPSPYTGVLVVQFRIRATNPGLGRVGQWSAMGQYQRCISPSGCGGFTADPDGTLVGVCDDVRFELIHNGFIPQSACVQW